MTTATSHSASRVEGSLDDHAQALIDARLDTIERMLLGQVSRADRLAIVREVESQIHDLMGERNANDTDRDAVIAALSRLDPPEAYLTDEAGATQRPNVARPSNRPQPSAARRPAESHALVGKAGGILGIISTVTILPWAMTMYWIFTANTATNATLVFFVLMGLTLMMGLTSILAVTLSAFSRLQSRWGVVGLTTGIIALLPTLGGVTLILMEMLGGM